jgi:type VI secretion system protein ImpH
MAGENGTPAGGVTPAAPAPAPAAAVVTGGPAAAVPAASRAPLSRERAAAVQPLLDMVARAPYQFDFFQLMRRLESLHGGGADRPRFGAALRPADEPIRLGQEPSLAFAPSALAGLTFGRGGGPPRLAVHFFGLFGPNGPLPLHITEYARERARNAEDPTMSRFMDVFHHRMLMLFYRAWSSGQPTVSHDRPDADRFVDYVGALIGIGLPAFQGRDEFPDAAKLFYAGRLGPQARNADGLAAMIGDFFRMPARVEQFVGGWLPLPAEHQWRLGKGRQGGGGGGGGGRLGMSTTAGRHAWSRQQKFRVVLGPLDRTQFQRMLPGGGSLKKLTALVRNYIGDEFAWDVRLILDERTAAPCQLGKSRLGWTSWLGRPGRAAGQGRREDLILDPQAENQQQQTAA